MTQSLISMLEKLNKFNQARPFDEVISQLQSVSDSLNIVVETLNTVKDNVANGITPDLSPVSYTHLDVYKRQAYI